jgi:hypothetical protein
LDKGVDADDKGVDADNKGVDEDGDKEAAKAAAFSLMADTNAYLEESGFWMLLPSNKHMTGQHLLFYFIIERRYSQLVAIRRGMDSVGLVEFLRRNPDQRPEVFPSEAVRVTWQCVLRHVEYIEVPEVIKDMFERYLRDLDAGSVGKFN